MPLWFRLTVHENGQADIECLTANVKNEWLSALEVYCKFTEVGSKTDGDKRESEVPSAKTLGYIDNTLVNDGVSKV